MSDIDAQGNRIMATLAVGILALDQFTKWLVLRHLPMDVERNVIPGFFSLVHWKNTGAAWSMFHGNSHLLAIVSIFALAALFIFRRHFDAHTRLGQFALGLMFGGIVGNMIDRLMESRGHAVVDFLYFHVVRRDGHVAGFPAFNVADTAICVGVGLLFILSWRAEEEGEGKSESRNPKFETNSKSE